MTLTRFADDGLILPGKLAETLCTTSEELARTAGLDKDAVQHDRIRSENTKSRLGEVSQIIDRLEPRVGSALMAYVWYRSEAMAGFSGLTAMQLVQDGRAREVLDYLEAVNAGIHA